VACCDSSRRRSLGELNDGAVGPARGGPAFKGAHTSFHYGTHLEIREQRQATLNAAYETNPIRFRRLAPNAASIPELVWINPPIKDPHADAHPGREPYGPRQSSCDDGCFRACSWQHHQ
jgi:hypothetical protein